MVPSGLAAAAAGSADVQVHKSAVAATRAGTFPTGSQEPPEGVVPCPQ